MRPVIFILAILGLFGTAYAQDDNGGNDQENTAASTEVAASQDNPASEEPSAEELCPVVGATGASSIPNGDGSACVPPADANGEGSGELASDPFAGASEINEVISSFEPTHRSG